ncbi:hypothetical protein [Shewanella algae]|uniref:hypothetical protein n=1 Tax=Shewanella algae TaxID=38313 RepID=UPI0031F51EC1
MTVESIAKSLSHSRLSTYITPPIGCESHEAALGIYVWNQKVCSAMSSVFHVIEIALRNSIYDGYCEFVQESIVKGDTSKIPQAVLAEPKMWFKVAFDGYNTPGAPTKGAYMYRTCKDAERRLENEQKNLVPENYIAKLSLGFWVNFVDNDGHFSDNGNANIGGLYLWPHIRSKVFPNALKSKGRPLSINHIHTELSWFNQLRNRLAHHEPLWKGKKQFDVKSIINKVVKDYQRCLTILGWINPAMTRLIELGKTHEEIKMLTDLNYVKGMMALANDLDARPAINLLEGIVEIDETLRGQLVKKVTPDFWLLRCDDNVEFFAAARQAPVHAQPGNRVSFLPNLPASPKKKPTATKLLILT